MTTETETQELIACAECGVACPDGRVTEATDVTRVTHAGVRGPERTQDLGTCPACREKAVRIEAILARHPAAVHALGPVGARRAVQNVVIALDVLGRVLPDDVTDRDLSAAIYPLTEVG